MLSRVVFLLVLASFPADTSRTLQERYGKPISDSHSQPGSETYLVRPEIVASVRYGKSARVCDILVRPARFVLPINSRNNAIDSKRMAEILDELLPVKERGKEGIPSILDVACFGANTDLVCSGVEYDWEKVAIHRNGGNGHEQYATIRWKRDECHFKAYPNADVP
jgi:hypothetical protein